MTFAGTPCESQWCGISLKDEDGVAVDFKLFDDTTSCEVEFVRRPGQRGRRPARRRRRPRATPRPTATRAPTVSPLGGFFDEIGQCVGRGAWRGGRRDAEARTHRSTLMSTQVADDADPDRRRPTWRRRAAAEATYGHISKWETGGVTDMEMPRRLFCAPRKTTTKTKTKTVNDAGRGGIQRGHQRVGYAGVTR